ncbi:MAG: GldG family protein [Treponema sp.]|nr:GldG family protein [Treponema sp.]
MKFLEGIKNLKGLDSIKDSFKTKQVRYGGYAVLISLAVVIVLILINLMAGQAQVQIDLTPTGMYTLTQETLDVLDQVTTPVRLWGLWPPGGERQDVMSILGLYLAQNPHISFDTVDPDRNPGFIQRYDRERRGISRGSIIVEGETGFRIITPFDMYDFTQDQRGRQIMTGVAIERRITSALVYLGMGETPVIYEMIGHDSFPLAAMGINTFLERENFQLESINLLLNNVPSDAATLILNNPRMDIAPEEVDRLLDYLDAGGRFLVVADYNIQSLPNLNTVLASYGIGFDFGIVVEQDPNYVAFHPGTVLPDVPWDHPITLALTDKSRTPIVLLNPMPIEILEARRRTIDITPIMTTSPRAFLRKDLDEISIERIAADISGPFHLGAAVMDPVYLRDPGPQTRIVAIGSGSLLNLANQGFEFNRDVFLNSLIWLNDRPETINVRSRSLFILPMRLNFTQTLIFTGLFIVVIPVGLFATGLITWLKRRHL